MANNNNEDDPPDMDGIYNDDTGDNGEPTVLNPFGNAGVWNGGARISAETGAWDANDNVWNSVLDDQASFQESNMTTDGPGAASFRHSSTTNDDSRERTDRLAAELGASVVRALRGGIGGNRSTPSPPQPQLGVTGVSLASGLDVRHVPRSDNQQIRAAVRSKYDRGATAMERLKHERMVVKPLPTKLACSNVLNIVLAEDVTKHDIAADCAQWQVGVRAFQEVLRQNDMVALFQMPSSFDVDDPSQTQGPFIDLLTQFHLVSDADALQWEQWLNKNASKEDLESCSWAAQILQLSMTPELKTLVSDDLAEVDGSFGGAILMFKYATNHMVLRSQEAVDSLHDYVRNFDIRQFDGENVNTACTHIRAVIRALDFHGLPANALKSILSGFSKASTAEFRQLCDQMATMHRSTVLQSGQSPMSLKKKVFLVLKDLVVMYTELSTNHTWRGVGHDGAKFREQRITSSLDALTGRRESLNAMAARGEQPSRSKVKCYGCGEFGHIERDCPKKGRPSRGGRTRRDDRTQREDRRKRDDHRRRGGRSQHTSERQRRYKKAYQAAFEQFLDKLDDSGSDSDESLNANVAENENDGDSGASDESVDSIAAHAARMYSSLKE